jgi:hypothetical protein
VVLAAWAVPCWTGSLLCIAWRDGDSEAECRSQFEDQGQRQAGHRFMGSPEEMIRKGRSHCQDFVELTEELLREDGLDDKLTVHEKLGLSIERGAHHERTPTRGADHERRRDSRQRGGSGARSRDW